MYFYVPHNEPSVDDLYKTIYDSKLFFLYTISTYIIWGNISHNETNGLIKEPVVQFNLLQALEMIKTL